MQQTDLDLDQVRNFLAIADAGSLKAAARLIGRDVAIVSRRLKALETRLGVRLVERNTRRIALTPQGLAYRESTAPLLRALDEAEHQIIAAASGAPRGHVRVAAPVSFGQYWLRPLLTEFLIEHPGITIECDTANRFADLIAERVDVAIRIGALPDSGLTGRRVSTRRRALYASPALLERTTVPAHPSALATLPCLCASNHEDRCRWSLRHDDGKIASVTVSGPLMSGDASILVQAAEAGLGVLLTADWYVADALRDGRLRNVLPEWRQDEDAGVFVLMPASSGRTGAARTFSDWIAARLSAEPWLVR